MVSTHDPVQLVGAGRSAAIVGEDGIAVLRNRYDAAELAGRFVLMLVVGSLVSASVNSLWPGHRDAIILVYGIVMAAGLTPIVVYGLIGVVGAVIGIVAAIARPRETARRIKAVWRTSAAHRVADVVARLEDDAVRLVVERAEIRDIGTVRGWLRPTLGLALRSGRVLRLSAHPWWRFKLTRLARDLRERLGPESASD